MERHIFLKLTTYRNKGGSCFGSLEPALVDQRLEATGALELVEGLLLPRGDLPDDAVRLLPPEWEAFGDQFVQNSPECVHVRFLGGLVVGVNQRGLDPELSHELGRQIG